MTRLKEHFGGLLLPDKHAEPDADLAGLEEVVVKEWDPRKLPWYPDVFDQGQLGSCTANADNAVIEAERNLQAGKKLAHLSRLFTYYGERTIEGSLGQGDTGAYGSDGFKWAKTKGLLPETEWQYVISTFQRTPTSRMFADASKNLLQKSTKIVPQTTSSIHKVLSNKQMISFGFAVYENFEEQAYWIEGPGDDPNTMPDPSGPQIGGHQIVQVGFLEKYPYHILCRNSWSSGWQKDGHFLFPIKHLTNKKMCSDFTTVVIPL